MLFTIRVRLHSMSFKTSRIILKQFYSQQHIKRIKNPYEILNLTESATPAEIKKKYKELAKELHPDKKSTGNLAKFQELVEAYEILIHHRNTSKFYYHASPKEHNRPPTSSHTNTYYRASSATTTINNNIKYTSNATFLSILAGIVVTIGALNLFYFHSSHEAFINAANQHHIKTTEDLKRARTEAKLFGNDRGVKRTSS
ncbi:uncharacterized protein BX663DRAFT_482765 [Cokeromyces recurvatus]|uniref:uncharacterized protein n=1 Tax=Cokeromyces recurvatus TaxID=90255 RepID=UPI00221E6058|nr:uncharacterized protein BX663DRAFT_482765 [Cokeromyces recurvatus]KAI7907092.1 hypothetical protein BX663DRAFT_482765 [Cokeromyces recurvatus]